jgi:hypothetical protein
MCLAVLQIGDSENLNSGSKWIAGLKAAMLAASRRQDEQATAPEPQCGVKAKVALAAVKGDKTAGRAGAAV